MSVILSTVDINRDQSTGRYKSHRPIDDTCFKRDLFRWWLGKHCNSLVAQKRGFKNWWLGRGGLVASEFLFVGNVRKLVNRMLFRGLECKCENMTSQSRWDVTCDSLGDVTWGHGTHDVRDLSGRSYRSRMRKSRQKFFLVLPKM